MSSIICRKIERILPLKAALLTRTLSVTSVCAVKEIQRVVTDKDVITIKGIVSNHPTERFLVKGVQDLSASQGCGNQIFCPECTLALNIKHTDVLILKQYVRSDGCMLPQRITGLCRRQQRRIGSLVTMAQKAGLMPNIAPSNSKMDPKKRFQWKKFNKYFDENTINC